MAVFYLQQRAAEGLAGPGAWSKSLSTGLSNPGSETFTVPNASSSSCLAITNRLSPSNADFEDGTITIKLEVTTANSLILCATQVVRFNAAGAAQENTGTTAEQTLSATGTYTFTHTSTTWTAGACDDRIGIWFYFRSTNSHGGAVGVTIETGTVNSEVSWSALTRSGGVCTALTIHDSIQIANDRITSIEEGGFTEGDGVSNDIFLDSLVQMDEWFDNDEEITPKVEVDETGTAFSDVASNTEANSLLTNFSFPHIRRSHSACYDSTRNRYLMCGGIDDTDAQFNDLWELRLDDQKPQWRELAPTGTAMSARRTHVMEYDATNDRVIIGFGYDGADKADIFEIDFAGSADGAWGTLSPSGTAPAARAQPSSAFKATGDKFYLVCGWGATRFNDIQELDCTTQGSEVWTELEADNATGGTVRPERRNDPAVIYDATNDRLMLFGGYDGTVYQNDVWEYDIAGTAWAEITPTGTGPDGRELALTCYDSVNERMMVFGGRDGTAQSNVKTNIFELDLTDTSEAWLDVTEAEGIRNLGVWTNGIAIYHEAYKAMIYFGGMDESLYETRQTFAFDLSTDGEATAYGLHINNGINGRDAMGYAYNPDRRETLFVGGYRDPGSGDLFNGEHTSEMWIYDHANSRFYQAVRNSVLTITPREGATAVYDTSRNRYLIFGGFTGNAVANNYHYNDVWALTYNTANEVYDLTKLSPTGTAPSARWLHSAVFDITNNRMMIFGGDADGTYQNDLHELDFSGSADGAWAVLSPTGTPPSARRQATYIYDQTNGRMIITHGATSSSVYVGDTFELDLSTNNGAWTTLSPTGTAPTNRRGMTGSYAHDKGYMFCFGGFSGSVLGDTFYLDLTDTAEAWVTLSVATVPTSRRSHMAGYDETSEKVIMYGGRDAPDDGDSFTTRNNHYLLDTSDVTESNWNWTFFPLYPSLQIRVAVTSLTASTDYHWQSLATGDVQNDSDWVSAFANAESAADFNTGSATGDVTISVNEAVTISEDIQIVNLTLGGVDIFDGITITEDITIERISASLDREISVSDDVVITEDIQTSNLQLGSISVSDSIALSEDLTVEITSFEAILNLSVSDTILVSEYYPVSIPGGVRYVQFSGTGTLTIDGFEDEITLEDDDIVSGT